MNFRTMDIFVGNSGFKPFTLEMYKGAQVVGFVDKNSDPTIKLLVLEEFSEECEERTFCFYTVNANEDIPTGAKYISFCRGEYWTPFALFEITGCELPAL